MMENILHYAAEYTVFFFDIVCLGIVLWGGVSALIALFRHPWSQVALRLSGYMDTALLFKLAAEIARLTYVRTFNELAVVAGIIALHAAIAVIIHFEAKGRSQNAAHAAELVDDGVEEPGEKDRTIAR